MNRPTGPECVAIQYMKTANAEEASRPARYQDGIFTSALNVISDIQEYEMTPMDIEVLHMLIDFICAEGHGELRSLIYAEAPNCEICAALVARMDSNQARDLKQ